LIGGVLPAAFNSVTTLTDYVSPDQRGSPPEPGLHISVRRQPRSLTLYAGATSPGSDKESNWLPPQVERLK
jgi:hypothetical protein